MGLVNEGYRRSKEIQTLRNSKTWIVPPYFVWSVQRDQTDSDSGPRIFYQSTTPPVHWIEWSGDGLSNEAMGFKADSFSNNKHIFLNDSLLWIFKVNANECVALFSKTIRMVVKLDE